MPIPTAELLAEVPTLEDHTAAALQELQGQLVAERAERERLHSELDLRDSALDSAQTTSSCSHAAGMDPGSGQAW